MPLELSVTGPGLEVKRLIDEGQSVLVGRDVDCDLCLPDPQRTVSRQHLVIWVEAGCLQFRVLSVVNGVDLPSGEVPPGGVATLLAGEVLMVGDYDIVLGGESASPDPDPSAPGILGHEMFAHQNNHAEEDPFGEWGFDTTVGHRFAVPSAPSQPDRPQTQYVPADGAATIGEVGAFFRGLGLDPGKLGALNLEQLEAAGRKVRMALQSLVQLHAAKLDLTREMGADERTMVATRENNPLKTDWPLDTKLEYLLAARASGTAFLAPEAALGELIAELRIHDMAVTSASRAVLEGALREFEPRRLESRFAQDNSSSGLLSRLRPWDAYGKFYVGESRRMAQWIDRLFNRYFTSAYVRETTRLKRGGRHGE